MKEIGKMERFMGWVIWSGEMVMSISESLSTVSNVEQGS
jgi:hypothetical protein